MAYNLNGKYPAMANYLIVSRNKKDIYRVENVLTEDIFEFDAVTYRFLKCLDGNTNPKKIGRKLGVDVDELMDFFDMNWLIRTDGKELLSGTSNKLVTCYVPTKKRTNSIIPKLLNWALVFAWLPIFSCGVERYCYKTFYINDDYMVIGYLFALFVGLVLIIPSFHSSIVARCINSTHDRSVSNYESYCLDTNRQPCQKF